MKRKIWLPCIVVGCLLVACLQLAPGDAPSPSFTAVAETEATSEPAATATSFPTSAPTLDSHHPMYLHPIQYRVTYASTLISKGYTFRELQVYLSQPVNWDGQSDMKYLSVSPAQSMETSDPASGNGFYYWELAGKPKPGMNMEFVIQFDFTAFETSTRVYPDDILPYSKTSALYKRYTAPERFVESKDPVIANLAKSIGSGETNPWLLARRIYDYIVANAHYRLVGKGLLGAKALLKNGEGECGDYSALFVALARASGIPARPVVGYWAISGTDQTHVWAEFYLEGYGWVPVDPTVGQADAQKRDYYFGHMDNQRVILHKEFNLTLDPPAPGNYLAPLMQGPAYWFTGSGNGNSVRLDVTRWIVVEY